MARGRLDMPGLVVKEEVGLELAQELAFGQAPQEHGFVDLDVPVHERADCALVRRGAACRHQRRADAHARRTLLLQALQRLQQGFERPGQQGLGSLFGLVLLESGQTMGLVDAFGLVAEQHRITVERNPHFMRMRLAGVGRLGVHLRGGHPGVQGRPHVAQMRRQEQVGMQGLQVAPGCLPARKAATLYGQAVVAGGAEHAHARDRVVTRQNHHLHGLRCRPQRYLAVRWRSGIGGWPIVKSEQFTHQRKCHAGFGGLVQPLQLQRHVGAVAVLALALLEHRVFFLEVKQRPRRNRHHQFAFEGSRHDSFRLTRFVAGTSGRLGSAFLPRTGSPAP